MSSALVEGQLIAGRYRLLERVGSGGMGVVWKARHTVTRRTVALKLMLAPLQSDEQSRQRFLVEARAAAAVDHPNVVSVHDVFVLEDGTSVMVMDYLSGESLRTILEREGALSVGRAADVFSSIVSAVGAAHALGVLHRDLKPENVFLTEDADPSKRVRVLDFGLAKLLGGERIEGQRSLTNTGARLGTPHYMSPEQASGSRDVDHRADEWSIGVMLYEALSGMRPIEGASLAELYEKVLTEAIMPLRAVRPDLPPDLLELVDRLLQRSPAVRPEDLREVAEVLGRHASFEAPAFGVPGSASRQESPPTDSDRVVVVTPDADADARTQAQVDDSLQLPPRRPPCAALVAGALVVIGLAVWAGTRTHEAKENDRAPTKSTVDAPTALVGALTASSATAAAPASQVLPPAQPSSAGPPAPIASARSQASVSVPAPAPRRPSPQPQPTIEGRQRPPEIEGFVDKPPF